MKIPRSQFAPSLIFSLTFALAFVAAQAQPAPATRSKLNLKAALVLTPEFCATKFSQGSFWTTGKDTFSVGKMACKELEPALNQVFSNVSVVKSPEEAGDAQVVLTPKFVSAGATNGTTAFSHRNMNVFLEWTVKDSSGKTVWLQTVQGTSKHRAGNMYTHSHVENVMAKDSVEDAAEQSALKMAAAPALKKIGQ
jgi:hypothetical protein